MRPERVLPAGDAAVAGIEARDFGVGCRRAGAAAVRGGVSAGGGDGTVCRLGGVLATGGITWLVGGCRDELTAVAGVGEAAVGPEGSESCGPAGWSVRSGGACGELECDVRGVHRRRSSATVVLGGAEWTGMYLRRNFLLRKVTLPEPSVLMMYWSNWRTSVTRPVLSHFFGCGPTWF